MKWLSLASQNPCQPAEEGRVQSSRSLNYPCRIRYVFLTFDLNLYYQRLSNVCHSMERYHITVVKTMYVFSVLVREGRLPHFVPATVDILIGDFVGLDIFRCLRNYLCG